MAIYFYDYRLPAPQPTTVLQSPFNSVRYFLSFLGSVHSNGEPFVAVLASLGLFSMLAFIVRDSKHHAFQIVIGFVVAAAALTTMGRIGLGVEQAFSIRYLSVSLYFTLGVLGLAIHAAPRIAVALLLGAIAATEAHACIRGIMFSYGDWRARMYGRACVSLSQHTTDGCAHFALYPSWQFLNTNAPVMERLGLFRPGMFKGELPSEGTAIGQVDIEGSSVKGWAEKQSDPIHAVILCYPYQGSLRWFGITQPGDPEKRIFRWHAPLEIPTEAKSILVFGYNADSGRAIFIAKASVPR